MNRLGLYGVAATSIVAAALFSSCQWSQKSAGDGETEAPDTLVVEAFDYIDTASVISCHVYQRLAVDVPLQGDTTVLADSLREWMASAVEEHYMPLLGDETEPFRFSGDRSNIAELLKAAGKAGVERMSDELKLMAGEGFETEYTNDFEANLSYQTDRFVTIETKYDIYTGGAHGAWIYKATTFRRRDGAVMGWNMLDLNQKDKIIALIKEGIKEYVSSADNEVKTDEQLFECLMLWDDPDTPENELEFGLPLPATPPCLLSNGMFFCYQQYEIAPYALGLPMVTVPYDVIAPLLSAEGKELLDLK